MYRAAVQLMTGFTKTEGSGYAAVVDTVNRSLPVSTGSNVGIAEAWFKSDRAEQPEPVRSPGGSDGLGQVVTDQE